MTKNVKELLKALGLFLSVLLAVGACCITTHARPRIEKTVSLEDEVECPAVDTFEKSNYWVADIHFNPEDEGVVCQVTSDNICGYGASIIFPTVESDLQEMLDAKHLQIIEVNLVRFTDVEPWNELEPDVQSVYFVVNPYENHGDVTITWKSPEIDVNLAQGFRQSGARCCFTLSVNNSACYLYAPGSGGEGVARKHVGFNDNVLLVDKYLTDKLEKIIQAF